MADGADEELALRDGDAGADVIVPFLTHRRTSEDFKSLARAEHENIPSKVYHVDFAVGGGGGSFNFGFAFQDAVPQDFPGGRLEAGQGFSIAVQNVKTPFVEYMRGNIRGNLP